MSTSWTNCVDRALCYKRNFLGEILCIVCAIPCFEAEKHHSRQCTHIRPLQWDQARFTLERSLDLHRSVRLGRKILLDGRRRRITTLNRRRRHERRPALTRTLIIDCAALG